MFFCYLRDEQSLTMLPWGGSMPDLKSSSPWNSRASVSHSVAISGRTRYVLPATQNETERVTSQIKKETSRPMAVAAASRW